MRDLQRRARRFTASNICLGTVGEAISQTDAVRIVSDGDQKRGLMYADDRGQGATMFAESDIVKFANPRLVRTRVAQPVGQHHQAGFYKKFGRMHQLDAPRGDPDWAFDNVLIREMLKSESSISLTKSLKHT